MSLLEDIFLGDEAEEAAELERIVEGDEYDERPQSPQNSDDNSEKEDEAEEDKRRVDPTSGTKAKREIKNPRFVLNPARLTGPRGIQVIPEHFKDFRFKGKGHEKEDLDMVLKKLEHWAYRLYPKFQFEDCLNKIETLGKKRPVTVHLHKIRSDQLVTEETVVQQDSDDEPPPAPQEEDEFDKLLQQQIELARATPASVRKPGGSMQTPISDHRSPLNLPSLAPKATSSPSISDEQRERMLLNRRLAEERRLAKFQTNSGTNTNDAANINAQNEISHTSDVTSHDKNTENPHNSDTVVDKMNVDDVINSINALKSKKNRSQVIDTSDSEDDYDKATKKNKDSTFDSLKPQSDEKINIDFEIENINAFKTKKNRSQVIDSDSSDSESGFGTTVNHITVDIDVHKAASQVCVLKDVSETPMVDLTNITTEKNGDKNSLTSTDGRNCDIPTINLAEESIEISENSRKKYETSKNTAVEMDQEKTAIYDEVLNETEFEGKEKGISEKQTESVENGTEISETQTESVENNTKISEKQTESVENDTEISEKQKGSVENDTEISEKQTESVENDTEISEKQTESVDNDTELSGKQIEYVENDTEISEKQTESAENNIEMSEKSISDFQDTNVNKHVNLENTPSNKENIDLNVVKPTEIVDEIMDLDFSDDF